MLATGWDKVIWSLSANRWSNAIGASQHSHFVSSMALKSIEGIPHSFLYAAAPSRSWTLPR